MAAPTISTTLASAGSTLTVSSMPSLVAGGGSSPTGSMTPAVTTPMSASAMPIQTPSISTKHCTFALTPTTIPPPPNQVSFLATARYHPSLRHQSSPSQTPTSVTPLQTPTSINASSISFADLAAKPMQITTTTSATAHHPTLEMRQSVQSEMTTVEDEYDDIMEMASSSSSMSSLGVHGEK